MLPYESPLIVLAQNRSKNNPTSKLIHGPVPCAIRSVTAVRVWMTLSLGGAGGPGGGDPGRGGGAAARGDPGGRTCDGRARGSDPDAAVCSRTSADRRLRHDLVAVDPV